MEGDLKWVDELRVVDLKEELRKRGLKVSGLKRELVERLKEALTTKPKEKFEDKDSTADGKTHVSDEENIRESPKEEAPTKEKLNSPSQVHTHDSKKEAEPTKNSDDFINEEYKFL